MDSDDLPVCLGNGCTVELDESMFGECPCCHTNDIDPENVRQLEPGKWFGTIRDHQLLPNGRGRYPQIVLAPPTLLF